MKRSPHQAIGLHEEAQACVSHQAILRRREAPRAFPDYQTENYAFLKKLIMLACLPLDLGAAFFALPPLPPVLVFSAAVFSKPPPPFLAFFGSGGGGARVWLVLAGCRGSWAWKQSSVMGVLVFTCGGKLARKDGYFFFSEAFASVPCQERFEASGMSCCT